MCKRTQAERLCAAAPNKRLNPITRCITPASLPQVSALSLPPARCRAPPCKTTWSQPCTVPSPCALSEHGEVVVVNGLEDVPIAHERVHALPHGSLGHRELGGHGGHSEALLAGVLHQTEQRRPQLCAGQRPRRRLRRRRHRRRLRRLGGRRRRNGRLQLLGGKEALGGLLEGSLWHLSLVLILPEAHCGMSHFDHVIAHLVRGLHDAHAVHRKVHHGRGAHAAEGTDVAARDDAVQVGRCLGDEEASLHAPGGVVQRHLQARTLAHHGLHGCHQD
mmetsp:Transcript_61977/g.202151  ORF Transcript_61977/g.202151 Transcript_61977/m.202151 type:complete len:276 (-) Transcript_61977:214-1041(-)